MAMTASLACNPTTVPATGNGDVNVTLTVSNSAGAAVNVVSIKPIIYNHGTQQRSEAAASGQPILNANNCSVPNGGNATFNWIVNFFAPETAASAGGAYEGANNPTTMSWDIGAEVVCADGTVIYPSVVAITVNAAPHS